MCAKSEARKFSRSVVSAKAEARLNSGVLVEGRALDVSLNGVLFTSERIVPVGNKVRLTLVLEGSKGPVRIEACGNVVRIEESGVAIRFTEMDSENVERLRWLVQRDATEPNSIDNEFGKYCGFQA